MSDFLEIDPHTGIKTQGIWSDQDQEYTLIRSADVEPTLDYAKSARAEVGLNREGMKKNWWLYAVIPPIVQVQLRAKGINITDADHQARMLAEINSNYPHLKMTTGNEGGRKKIIVG